MSNRLDKDREAELQPKRLEYAKAKLKELGLEITKETATEINFLFKGETIRLFPYSGWHQGKGIKSGRGIDNLLKQLT